jgi:hypothetical protein
MRNKRILLILCTGPWNSLAAFYKLLSNYIKLFA